MRDEMAYQEEPPAGEVGYPRTVLIAGVIWIVIGSLIVLNAAVNLLLSFVMAGAGRVNAPGGICGALIGALFGAAFVHVGMQSTQGTARDTLGNGIGSLLLGLLNGAMGAFCLVAAFATGGTPAVVLGVAGGISLLSALALEAAGILALVGRQQYNAWKQPQQRRSPRRAMARFGPKSQAHQGTIRCPACRQKALPRQTFCLHCNARLDEVSPVEEPLPVLEVSPADDQAVAITNALPLSGGTFALTEKPISGGRHCPSCNAGLAETAVLCVQCGYDFRLGKTRGTVVQKVDPEARRGLNRERVTRFPLVLQGLTFHNARILLSLLATLLIVGITAFGAAHPARQPPLWVGLVILAGVALWLLSITLGFIGSIFCMWVPSASSGRWPLAVALVFDVVTVPVGVLGVILEWTPLLAWVTGLCSWALFLVFLMRLAAYIDRPSEAQEGRTLLLFGLLMISVPVVFGSMAAMSAGGDGLGLTIAVCLGFSGFLYFRVQFLVLKLLESLRASIGQQLDEARQQVEASSSAELG